MPILYPQNPNIYRYKFGGRLYFPKVATIISHISSLAYNETFILLSQGIYVPSLKSGSTHY